MRAFLFAAAACLSGCAMPGIPNLMENGTTRTLQFAGQPGPLAECLTTARDSHGFELGVLPAPVTRSRALDGGGVELQGGDDPPTLTWLAVLTPVGPTATSVALTTRDAITLSMSGSYLASVIEGELRACEPAR